MDNIFSLVLFGFILGLICGTFCVLIVYFVKSKKRIKKNKGFAIYEQATLAADIDVLNSGRKDKSAEDYN